MIDNILNLYCDCDEHLGEINVVTKDIKLKKDIKYTIEDKEHKTPTVVCKCPCCKQIDYFRGHIR